MFQNAQSRKLRSKILNFLKKFLEKCCLLRQEKQEEIMTIEFVSNCNMISALSKYYVLVLFFFFLNV
jgi:restriction endonuclease S subunit